MSSSAFFGHAIPDSSSSNRESLLHNPSSDSMLVSSTGREVSSDCGLDGGLGRPTSVRTLEGKRETCTGIGTEKLHWG